MAFNVLTADKHDRGSLWLGYYVKWQNILYTSRTSILVFSPGWQKNENVWKSLGGIMVNVVPLEVPRSKILGACGPSGFGLGTSLRTPFTTLPPRLFQTMSQFLFCYLCNGSLGWTRLTGRNVCCQYSVINRPGVAGAVQQKTFVTDSFIHSVSQSSFSSQSSKHHKSQTVKS